MSYILSGHDSTPKAYKGEEFTYEFPNIISITTNVAANVEDMSGDGTEWEITLTNFPTGMELYQSETNKSTQGFLEITAGQLNSVQMRWEPTAGQSYFVQDGRLVRPRFWVMAVQINGKGGWSGFQFEFGISIETTDHREIGEEIFDTNSIDKHGINRDIGLNWYNPDHLEEALARRYKDPPRLVTHQIATVQEDMERLTEVMSIEPGEIWRVGTSGEDASRTMNGMAMSVGYEIGPGGRGVGYKRVTFIERFTNESVIFAINDIPITVNSIELGVEK